MLKKIFRYKYSVNFFLSELSRIFVRCPVREHFAFLHTFVLIKTLFTWSGGPRSSGVSFFCFVPPERENKRNLPH